ncbi:ABC transporter permease [Turicimonas muris]|uniref:ABC transporter permease n=1 Tax=Turicimonas muris TaxID=1796652 RepID=UPI00339CFC16
MLSALWRFVNEAPTTEPYGGCCERGTGQPNPLLDPLTFLSGVFYSIQQLPGTLRTLSQFNPFFYIVDGFRYGFFSQSDFNPWISLSVVLVCAVGSAAFAVLLMQRGYKIQK